MSHHHKSQCKKQAPQPSRPSHHQPLVVVNRTPQQCCPISFPPTTGAQGAQGGPGPQGPQGDPGASGTLGAQGFQGAQGDPGAQGSQGQTLPLVSFFANYTQAGAALQLETNPTFAYFTPLSSVPTTFSLTPSPPFHDVPPSLFNTATGLFTAPITGYYQFNARYYFDVSVALDVELGGAGAPIGLVLVRFPGTAAAQIIAQAGISAISVDALFTLGVGLSINRQELVLSANVLLNAGDPVALGMSLPGIGILLTVLPTGVDPSLNEFGAYLYALAA